MNAPKSNRLTPAAIALLLIGGAVCTWCIVCILVVTFVLTFARKSNVQLAVSQQGEASDAVEAPPPARPSTSAVEVQKAGSSLPERVADPEIERARIARKQIRAIPGATVDDDESRWIFHDRPANVGDKGPLFDKRVKIIQIIDGSNAIGEVVWYSFGLEATPSGIGGVSQRTNRETVWLTMPTSGLVDDRYYEVDRVFEVTGTRSYGSKAGRRTVLHLKAIAGP